MKYYDKMHYEEELDLFCRCIRANISIILHKTVYEINSTLLLRTHFKPPSSVCNNFILRSHTLWAAAVHYISNVSPKKRNPRLCHFSRDCTFKIAQLWGEKPRPWQHWFAVPFSHTSIISLAHCLSLGHTRSLSRTLSLSLLSHTLALSLSLGHTLSLSTFASLSSSRAPQSHNLKLLKLLISHRI